uniref:Zinc finger CCHC-type containing 9 n=1 Tax=Anser cygnoides TaxID=8845 RepID=A0A8B9E6D5_ANSCY
MTRWARKAAAEGGKALPATPWEEMAAAPRGAVVPARKRRRRKEYADRDVNGFAAHLRKAAGGGAAEGEEQQQQQEDEEEAAAAVRKALRREGRRAVLLCDMFTKMQFLFSKVCFHCREPGHGVADCPAVLESQDMGTGICYRCGSTEHDISKCKAKIDPAAGAFPYAKCFICGEMGHLSRSCPDNPKGLYAEGECRNLLQTKCIFPSYLTQSKVTVGRWATGMSADYEEVTETPKLQKPKAKLPKVVNF